MKVYYQNQHVKTIPKRFNDIKDICDHFEDLETTRLTDRERRFLEMELCKDEIEALKARQKPAIYEQIKDASPIAVSAVHTKHSDYSVMNFSSGFEIRCSERLFNLFPIKHRINRLY